MALTLRGGLAGLLTVLASGAAGAAQPGPSAQLAEARRLYNQARYDAAIELASTLTGTTPTRDAAWLIVGRAGLERFRQSNEATDLQKARDALRHVDPSALDARDRLELVVGIGEALYLEKSYGPAAEVFDSVVERAGELGPKARDQVLDWWATSLDRYAQALPLPDRLPVYVSLREGMARELRRDPSSATASYWAAAASRVLGDLDGAWAAAMAAWVRTQLMADRGASIKPELDRLVLQGIIPERARRLGGEGSPDEAITSMVAEWEAFKARW
jgi:hypothetical protein